MACSVGFLNLLKSRTINNDVTVIYTGNLSNFVEKSHQIGHFI